MFMIGAMQNQAMETPNDLLADGNTWSVLITVEQSTPRERDTADQQRARAETLRLAGIPLSGSNDHG